MTTRRAARVTLERIAYDPGGWGAIVDAHSDAEVYQGPPRLAHLGATQGAEPVIAIVRQDGRPVGHFVGGIVRRYGIRILGSPLRGWGTQVMGFLLDPGTDRVAAAEALLPFAFRDLGCAHVEPADRQLPVERTTGMTYQRELGITFRIDQASVSRRLAMQTSRPGHRP